MMVHRPSSASRYDSKFTLKTMKNPGSVMVWGLSVEIWAGIVCSSLYNNVAMKSSIYINILKEYLCTFRSIH